MFWSEGFFGESIIAKGPRSDVSRVRASVENPNTFLCLKRIRVTDGQSKRMIENELTVAFTLSSYRPPNFVRIHEWYWEETTVIPTVVFVMEYCYMSFEDFLSFVKTNKSVVSPVTIAEFVRDMLSALSYIEYEGIVHQDIKPSNILWGGCWKLSDFGSIHHNNSRGFVGTILTASPESLKCTDISSKSDVWSFGCVIWESINLDRPFRAMDLLAFQNSIIGVFPISKINVSTNDSRRRKILSFLKRTILIPEPNDRPTASCLLQMDFTNKLITLIDYANNTGLGPNDLILNSLSQQQG